MQYVLLPQRGFISLSGEDAVAFLQDLVTNDVTKLAEKQIMYAALLSPQGKFLQDFFLIAWEDKILVECEKTALPTLLQRFKNYRLRAKVLIEEQPDISVAALWNVPVNETMAADDVLCLSDPRIATLGLRVIGTQSAIELACKNCGAESANIEAYEYIRLNVAIPYGPIDLVADKSFPMQFGLEDLQGVDFKKGCYVGQEVTARTKHLGQLKKFIYKVQIPNGDLPLIGTPVFLDGIQVGEMRSSLGNIGLALLDTQSVIKALQNGGALEASGHVLQVSLPDWAIHAPR